MATKIFVNPPVKDLQESIDGMVREAVAAGGKLFRPPQDHGFMYEHAFQDLDGHIWEVMHIDPAAPASD